MSSKGNVNRNWIAFLLTAQDAIGVVAGMGVQTLLVFLMFGWGLHILGTNLIALDRWFASLQLPALLLAPLSGG